MDLRRLEYFVAIVDHGTVSAAAARLHVAQPALSRQVAALERELRLTLFARDRGRLRLTAAGATYARLARDLLGHADHVGEAARALAAGRPARLAVAAPTATINEVVAPFLATLGPIDPLVTAHEHPALASAEESLGTADVVICAGPPSAALTTRTLGDVPLCAQVPVTHRWASAGLTRIDVGELATEPLIVQTPDNMSRVLLDSALAARRITAQPTVTSALELVVQALAASGHGVGVLTERPRFGLHAVRLYDGAEPMLLTMHAAWRPDHFAHAVIEAIVQRLAACLETAKAEIAGQQGWGEQR
jgi:DNA-binding transcriptional LysR family regulator